MLCGNHSQVGNVQAAAGPAGMGAAYSLLYRLLEDPERSIWLEIDDGRTP